MKKGKILIGMYGRSGTSLLVGILGKLGFNTGFSDANFDSMQKHPARAGLENGRSPDAILNDNIEVLKPVLINTLLKHPQVVKERCECFLFPVRGISKAIESRKHQDKVGITGYGGTMNNKLTVESQQRVFGELIDLAACMELPIKFMVFPKWVEDFDYFYSTLKDSFDVRNISKEEVEKVFKECVNLDFIRIK